MKEQFGKEPNRVSCLAVKSALLGTRHPRKEKEAALQTVTGKPACLDGKILMSTQSEKEPSVKICKKEVRSSQPAGSPIHRASQGLLPGAPTKKGAAYLPYLERPTKPTTKGGGVHTYIPIHTYLDYKRQRNKLKRGVPKLGTPPLRPLQIAASASNGAQTRSGLHV